MLVNLSKNQMAALCAVITSWDEHIVPAATRDYVSKMSRGSDVTVTAKGLRDQFEIALNDSQDPCPHPRYCRLFQCTGACNQSGHNSKGN